MSFLPLDPTSEICRADALAVGCPAVGVPAPDATRPGIASTLSGLVNSVSEGTKIFGLALADTFGLTDREGAQTVTGTVARGAHGVGENVGQVLKGLAGPLLPVLAVLLVVGVLAYGRIGGR